jgi:hypothetical protein
MLDGYIENTCFSNLKIPIRAGFYLPAKWIKWLNSGDISCFTAHDRPHDLPHIVPIYASTLSSNNTPAGLLPQWFRSTLTGPNSQFLTMVESACKFEDWGIVAELVHYRAHDEEVSSINLKICQLQLDTTAAEQNCVLSKQQLEASWCAKGLAHLKGLGPKSTCVKWGTCFTDNKDDDSPPQA